MANKDFNDYKELIKKNKLDSQKKKETTDSGISVGTILFCLENEYYCMETTYVKEIVKGKKITRLPNSYPFVKGLINLRGDIIPVIDLKKMFNLPSSFNSKILEVLIIIKVDDFVIGLLIDQVIGIISVNIENIEPPSPVLGFVNERYIDGVVKLPKYVAVLLNVREIFSLTQNNATISSFLSKEESFYRDIPKIEELSGFFIHSVNIKYIKELYFKHKGIKDYSIDKQFVNLIFYKFLSMHTNEIGRKPYIDYYVDTIRTCLKKYPFGKIKIMVLGSKNGSEAYSVYMLTSDHFFNADVYMTSYVQNVEDFYHSQNFVLTERELIFLDVDKTKYFNVLENNVLKIKEEISNKIKFDLYSNIENDDDLFDIIVARDVSLSMNETDYRRIMEKIVNKNLVINGLLVIGDNEDLLEGLNLISNYDSRINTFTKN